MKVHEFQAKQVLRKYGVPLQAGEPATTPDEAAAAADRIGGAVWVVKAQIHAGGRGLGRFKEQVSEAAIAAAARGERVDEGKGGVRLTRSSDEVRAQAADMLGQTLVTKQTGAEGKTVRTVFVEAGCDIAKELYLSMLLDRSKNQVMAMASTAGGMSIEDVAAENPDAIKKVWVDPVVGFAAYQGRKLAFDLGMSGKTVSHFTKFVVALYRAYLGTDATMIEINPLVITGAGDVVALDAKMTFDDSALFRHKDIVEMRDEHEEDPGELEAGEWDLSYVKLDGNIGCMVNGAGLAMSTMDIIKLKGAEPANFLDVGGGAGKEQVAAAFRIITSDPAVQGILVNIFGGIMKCDVIAEGVIAAVKEVGLQVPLVVRLEGTNVEIGKQLLAESKLAITPASTLDEAADAIVAAVGG
ncbi:MAG: ADP-forming succinate--CoA ligase subunit beta [Deltaproteobacteria bacterium]|nr:ADP-forming succinate--CoA ligase subunit beta [Deltaproteobacteria bacterium]